MRYSIVEAIPCGRPDTHLSCNLFPYMLDLKRVYFIFTDNGDSLVAKATTTPDTLLRPCGTGSVDPECYRADTHPG